MSMSIRRNDTIVLGLLKNKKKKEFQIVIFTSSSAYVNCAILAMLCTHSIGNQLQNMMEDLKCVIVYLA